MKSRLIILAILIGICLMVIPACAVNINLTQKTGETFIKWMWNDPTLPLQMIYVDGAFVKNTTAQYYYLTDLQPMEEHRIDIYVYNPAKALASHGSIASPDEIADLRATRTNSTTINSGLFYILLILLIALTIITAVIVNPIKGFLIGLFTAIFALALSFIAAFFMDWLIILSIITGVLAVIFTILHGQQIMKNSYFRFPWS
jgi:hypothetical protein